MQLRIAVFLIAYLGGAELGNWLTANPGNFATFWPNSGLFLAMLLRTPQRRWWIPTVAAICANLMSDVALHEKPLPIGLGFALANAVEALAAASVLRRWFGEHLRLDTLRDMLGLFAVGAFVGAPLGGGIGALVVSWAYGAPYCATWQLWWVADAFGVLLVAPLTLALLDKQGRPEFGRLAIGAAGMFCLTLAATFAFSSDWQASPYLLLLFLLWASLYGGVEWVALAALLLAIPAIRLTITGRGPFVGDGDLLAATATVQVFLGVSALLFHLFSVLLAERQRALTALEKVNVDLERRVQERTAKLQEHTQLLDLTQVLIRDLEGRILYWNAGASLLYGFAGTEALGRISHELLGTVFPRPLEEIVATLRRDGQWRGELTQVTRDGRRITVASSWTLHLGDGTQSPRVLEVNSDITQRRLAEEELRRARQHLETALSAGDVATWIWDVPEDRIWGDRNLNFFFGIADDAAQGLPLAAFLGAIAPEDREHLTSTIRESFAGGDQFQCEYRVTGADGVTRWVLARGRVERDENQQAVRMPGMVLDVTQRKEAEAAMRESEARYRTLFESIDDAFCILEMMFDADGQVSDYRFLDANPAFEPATGLSNVVGKTAKQLIPGLERRWFETYGRVARTGEPVRLENYSAAMRRWFDVYAFRFGSPEKHQVAVFFKNITERKRAEEAMQEADRRKDEFLATLAHELRNPLAPIRTGLQVMKLAGDDKQIVADARGMMERQLAQLIRLIDDLLDLSRISRGVIELHRRPVELATVLQNAVETSRPMIEAAGHALELEIPAEPIELEADAVRLGQVFSNLLNNAAKYTERGGRITLVAERRGDEAIVRVRDTGVGIPAPMLARIFEMFTQVDRSLEKSQGGLGVGLWLVQRLVDMHGGSVEAKSAGPEQGSEFVVRLPLASSLARRPASASAAAMNAAPGDARNGAPRRILVVDDNRDSADSLATLLNLLGDAAETAHDGLEAIERAAQLRPDVILLDIGMPNLNGYDAARRIRQTDWGRTIVLIAQTGWGQEEDHRKSHEAGFDAHLVKPIDPQTLLRTLDELQATRGGRAVGS